MRWAELPLQQVAEVVSGFGFPKDYQGDTEGEYPFLKVSDMNLPGNEVWMYESTNTISQENLFKLGAKVFPPGTVIFPKIGAAIATGKKRILFKPSTFDNNVMGLVPKAPILAPFLYYWSLTFDFQDIANIGPVPSLRKTTVEKLPILLPPISEQRRIVEILGQADALRKKRAEADEKSDRILPALFIKMFGDPVENPMDWALVEMKSLYKISPNYGTMIPAKSDEGEWLDLRVANIQNGCLDLSSKKYVDLPVEEIKRYEVLNGDLLVTRAIGSADHLGKCIVAYPGKEKWAFDSHLMRVRFDQDLVHPEFIRNFLLNPSGRQIFLQKTRKSAVQFNINTKEFGSIVLPLPPLEIQLKFVEEFKKLNIIQSKRYCSKQYLENLFNTCLHQAFSGELTAEWRKAHMNEILQEMEQQEKVLGIPHTVEPKQLGLSLL